MLFSRAMTVEAVDAIQSVRVQATVQPVAGKSRHHLVGRRPAIVFGNCLVSGVATAEFAADRRGKVERGDGKVVVDGGSALIGLAMDDVSGEIRTI